MSLVEEAHDPALAAVDASTKRRVLLVEDSPDYSELICHTLDSQGFEVTHCEYLDAAISQLEQRPFDALLLDLGLPDASGIFTLVSACRFADDLPIIVLTCNSDRSLAMAATEAGAQEYVIKDRIDRKSMPGLIRRAIERHQRRQSLKPVALPQRQRIHDAVRDPTTGLANDILFEDRLRQSFARTSRRQSKFALMVIQLDGFDTVCECCAADPCDRLLRGVADVLGTLFDAADTVARVDVASFAIILGEMQTRGELYAAAGPVLAALANLEIPEGLQPKFAHLSARVGAAIFPEEGQRPEQLLACALSQELATATLGAGEYQFRSPPPVD